ncbi:MAG: hypothetical protein QG635_2222, partial [Bacteroidota bacterium]|nr:hypothetical protein [Bacteroidota bacterium]
MLQPEINFVYQDSREPNGNFDVQDFATLFDSRISAGGEPVVSIKNHGDGVSTGTALMIDQTTNGPLYDDPAVWIKANEGLGMFIENENGIGLSIDNYNGTALAASGMDAEFWLEQQFRLFLNENKQGPEQPEILVNYEAANGTYGNYEVTGFSTTFRPSNSELPIPGGTPINYGNAPVLFVEGVKDNLDNNIGTALSVNGNVAINGALSISSGTTMQVYSGPYTSASFTNNSATEPTFIAQNQNPNGPAAKLSGTVNINATPSNFNGYVTQIKADGLNTRTLYLENEGDGTDPTPSHTWSDDDIAGSGYPTLVVKNKAAQEGMDNAVAIRTYGNIETNSSISADNMNTNNLNVSNTITVQYITIAGPSGTVIITPPTSSTAPVSFDKGLFVSGGNIEVESPYRFVGDGFSATYGELNDLYVANHIVLGTSGNATTFTSNGSGLNLSNNVNLAAGKNLNIPSGNLVSGGSGTFTQGLYTDGSFNAGVNGTIGQDLRVGNDSYLKNNLIIGDVNTTTISSGANGLDINKSIKVTGSGTFTNNLYADNAYITHNLAANSVNAQNLTVQSGNFTVDNNGDMTASDATFTNDVTILGTLRGNITAEDGTFNNLRVNQQFNANKVNITGATTGNTSTFTELDLNYSGTG